MLETLADLNLWAIVTSALLTFVLGALWYSPLLFASVWMRVHAISPEKAEAMQQGAGPIYLASLACYVVMATAFAGALQALGVQGLVPGLIAGLVVWVGFVAASGLPGNLFSDRPLTAWLLDGGYQLTYLLIMGAVLSVWR